MDTNVAAAPSPAPVSEAPAPALSQAEVMAKLQAAAPDALNALLGQAPAPVVPPAAPAPVETPAAPVAEVPAEPTAQPASEPQGEPQAQPAEGVEEVGFPKNWRVEAHDYMAAEFYRLQKPRNGKPGLSVPEAYEKVYGRAETPAPTTQTPAAPAPEPTAEVDAQIESLGRAVGELAAEIDQKAEDSDIKALVKLQAEQARKERQLEQLKTQREAIVHSLADQQVEQNVAMYQEQRKASAQEAVAAYPALADANGEARAQYNEAVERLRADKANVPLFDSPNWPMFVADYVARTQGWRSGAAPSAPPPPPPRAAPPPAPRVAAPPNGAVARATSAAVISPGLSSAGTGFTPTIETFRQEAAKATPEQLNAFLGSLGRLQKK